MNDVTMGKQFFNDFLNKTLMILHDRTSWKQRMKPPPDGPVSLS